MVTGGRTFNGSTQYGSLGAAASLNLSTFSIGVFLKNPLLANGSAGTILEALTVGTYLGYRLGLPNSVAANKLSVYDSVAWRSSSGSLAGGATWQHAGVSFTGGSTSTFYIGGSSAGTFTPSTPSSWSGAKTLCTDVDGLFFQTELSFLFICNIALSGADFSSISGGTHPNDIVPLANRIGLWEFAETGSTITDRWGANNITLFNTPGVSSDGPTVNDASGGGGGRRISSSVVCC